MSMPSQPLADPLVIIPLRRRSGWWMTLPLMLAVGTLAMFAWRSPPDGTSGGREILRFAGRLHPMLTHLPIGMLILMPFLDALGVFRRSRYLWASAQLVMWIATLAAIVTATAGYVLARHDGQGGEEVIDHQWAGIATAGSCCVALMFRSLARGGTRRKTWSVLYLLAMAFLFVCLAAAGHLGGKLSHGDTYLTEFAPEPIRTWLTDEDDGDGSAPIPTTKPATQSSESSLPAADRTVFGSIVQPIFVAHCVECHGTKKSKAGLQLDTFAHAMVGGESGSTIVPDSVADSELVRLIKLPRQDNDAMPPAKKQGLSAAEIEAIRWWIANGASETLKIDQAQGLPETVRSLMK